MEQFTIQIQDLKWAFFLLSLSFIIAILWTPLWTDFLYSHKFGKKIRNQGVGSKTPIFSKLHKDKAGTPNMGGVLIWVTVAAVTILLNWSRSGTWLPLFVLVATGAIGLLDDYLNARGIGPSGGGLSFWQKLVLYTFIAAVGAWWFAFKLDWIIRPIHIPGVGDWAIGYWYIPLFIVVMVWSAFAANQTDGLDGLYGGVALSMYGAFMIIALLAGNMAGNTALAGFCASIVGALLAFLWFNINPARFFMGDTGSMSLGMTIAVIAFLTNSVVVLPIIGFILVVESLSTVVQIFSKKFRQGKKVFLVAPIHHHFEAKGWPETKVTMRFWIVSAASAAFGLAIALIGRG